MGEGQAGLGILFALGGEGERRVKDNRKVGA